MWQRPPECVAQYTPLSIRVGVVQLRVCLVQHAHAVFQSIPLLSVSRRRGPRHLAVCSQPLAGQRQPFIHPGWPHLDRIQHSSCGAGDSFIVQSHATRLSTVQNERSHPHCLEGCSLCSHAGSELPFPKAAPLEACNTSQLCSALKGPPLLQLLHHVLLHRSVGSPVSLGSNLVRSPTAAWRSPVKPPVSGTGTQCSHQHRLS